MNEHHDCRYVYIEPLRTPFPLLFALGIVVVLVSLVAGYLDGLSVQIVGPILYPFEYALNAAFFPEVQTPLRPNGSALLVLLPTMALFAAVFITAHALFRAAARILGRR